MTPITEKEPPGMKLHGTVPTYDAASHAYNDEQILSVNVRPDLHYGQS